MHAGWLKDLSEAICSGGGKGGGAEEWGGRGLRVKVSEGQSSWRGAVLGKV